MIDRFEIFDKAKIGVMPPRKRHREFMNHSRVDGFNIVTNNPYLDQAKGVHNDFHKSMLMSQREQSDAVS